MPPNPDLPAIEAIISDLRLLRERGLVRVRHSDLPALRGAADLSGVPAAAGGGPRAVEALLRAAVVSLGDSDLGKSATATFGLDRGARDRPAQVRRRSAALAYHVSVERFRKAHERIVIEQVAEEILKLCEPTPLASRPGPPDHEIGQQTVLEGQVGGTALRVVVHVEPVELMSGVDILVAPTNIYLELPQSYKSSVSASLRRAAAIKTPDGQVVVDVIADELRAWIGDHGRAGLPVAPGTVVPTSAGEMEGQGVRRIYHVAITAPRPNTNDYDVDLTAIATGVQNVLAIARGERAGFDPQLCSVGFPLLGSGRGALDPAVSFAWMWTSIARDVRAHGAWDIHFISRQHKLSDLIVTKLGEVGFGRAEPGSR